MNAFYTEIKVAFTRVTGYFSWMHFNPSWLIFYLNNSQSKPPFSFSQLVPTLYRDRHFFTLSFFIASLTSCAQTLSPTVQATQGAYFTGGGVQLSWTTGQVADTNYKVGGLELSLGFQQPGMNLTVGAITGSPFCVGTQISVPFIATDFFGTGNIFMVQLSDSSGNFTSAIVVGTDTGIVSDTILATIPSNTLSGSHYRVRIVASYPVYTGQFSSADITIIGAPNPPTVPAPQGACSDSSVAFVIEDTVGINGNLIQWALTSSFDSTTTVASPASIPVTVNANQTDTVWLRSIDTGCSVTSIAVNTVLSVQLIPETPSAPEPQSTCSSGAVTFNFNTIFPPVTDSDIAVDWSLDSSFSNFNIVDTSIGLFVDVQSGTNDTIWLRNRNVISGCVSNLVFTTASVKTSPQEQYFYPTSTLVCPFTSVNFILPASVSGTMYTLENDSISLSSQGGTGDTIILNSGNIDSISNFYITAIDTAAGCITNYATVVQIGVVAPIASPVFIQADSTVCIGGSSCYLASADNSSQIIYSIISGDAIIDSFGGCVSSVTGDFTLEATAISLLGCFVADTSFSVTVPSLLPPVLSPPFIVCDSGLQQYTFYGITPAGCGGDLIQFSSDSTFDIVDTQYVPADYQISILSGDTGQFWMRSANAATGAVSAAIGITEVAAQLLPPIAPPAQVYCCASSNIFNFDSISVQCGGDSIEYSLDSSFTTYNSSAAPANIALEVDSPATVTLWLRSEINSTGALSSIVSTTATLENSPQPPNIPGNQVGCSDSTYYFYFAPIPLITEWADLLKFEF